jgi:hypothetical protein
MFVVRTEWGITSGTVIAMREVFDKYQEKIVL